MISHRGISVGQGAEVSSGVTQGPPSGQAHNICSPSVSRVRNNKAGLTTENQKGAKPGIIPKICHKPVDHHTSTLTKNMERDTIHNFYGYKSQYG